MRVAFDGRCFQDNSAFRGVGRYARGLLAGFESVADGDLQLRVLLDEARPVASGGLVAFDRDGTDGDGTDGDRTIFGHPTSSARLDVRHTPRAFRRFVLDRSLRPVDADLLHIPAQFYAFHAVRIPMPYVITVHDLIPFRMPDPGARPERLARRLRNLRSLCRRARQLLTVSEHSMRDCVDLLGVSPDRVCVVPEGVDRRFSETTGDDDGVLRRLGVRTPYFLYVGAMDPHKNLAGLIEAFRRFQRVDDLAHQLVVVGKVEDPELVSQASDGVRLMGFVEDENLPALYRGARAFVNLSLYEGFGLSALEAMACGVPVVAAADTAFPEIVGDAGLLVDARDPDAAARALGSIVREPGLAQRLGEQGLKRAARFSWERTAAGTFAAYQRALAG